MGAETEPLRVVAGAIVRDDGAVLAAQRAHGRLDGLWEFPGGKVEPGESDEDALVRELEEELGVTVAVDGHVATNVHAYPHRSVALHLYRCRVRSGTMEAREHAALRWMAPAELPTLTWAPADVPLVAALCAALGQSADAGATAAPENEG